MARFDIDVLVVSPGLTQTNFSKNMLEQKAKMPMDHMRGMTPEQAALAIIKAMERRTREVTLTLPGKLMVFVSRFLPGLADRIAKRKVRSLFAEEIAARRL
jgi:short-subunit dehydrogenase